jgi:hypothetical protein
LEGTLPRLQVLGGLWHFHVGVKLLYLVENGVFVIIFEVVITLLYETGVMTYNRKRTEGMYAPLALGPS